MKKIKGIICIYLTVAVLIGVAFVPLGANADVSEFVDTENTACESMSLTDVEKAENCDNVNTEADFSVPEASVNTNKTEEESFYSDATDEELIYGTQYASYVPGNTHEIVSGLNFFTDTYGRLQSEVAMNTYTFILDKRGVFRYMMIHDKYESAVGWCAALYQEYYVNGDGGEKAYRLINYIMTDPTLTTESSCELGLPKGNYRLVVTQGVGFTSDIFRISVTFVEGAKYETECNDNVYRYNDIYSDIPVKGTASKLADAQDEDWYRFTMNADGVINLSFAHAEIADKLSVCWQVILYSENMTELFSVNSEFNKPLIESGNIGLVAGDYYIAVKNRVYTDIIYTLTVKRLAADDAETERNDTKETANEIKVNTTITGSISEQIVGVDRDYYRFEIKDRGYIMLEFAHEGIADENDREGWNYVLHTEDGQLVFSGVSLWADDVSASPIIGLPEGIYYIRVDSEGLYLNAQQYYLTVSFMEHDEWETELNDSFDTADEIYEYHVINGTLADRRDDYDYDYYSFVLDEEKTITVDFIHEVLEYSREIFSFTLFDENGQAIDSIADVGGISNIAVMSDVEKTSAEYALTEGRYYIRVSAGIFFDTIGYRLSFYESIKEDIL